MEDIKQELQENETSVSTVEETELISDDDIIEETEEIEEEEEYVEYIDQIVFGMPKMQLQAVILGFAMGYIISGLLGLAGFTSIEAWIPYTICALIGYLAGGKLRKIKLAERDAKREAEANSSNM